MRVFENIFTNFLPKERKVFFIFAGALIAGIVGYSIVVFIKQTIITPVAGGSWREGVVGPLKTANPVFGISQADQDVAALLFERMEKLITDVRKEPEKNIYFVSLKQNLLWSDAKPFTADDVIFTVSRIQDPDSRSPLFKNWQGVTTERVSELQIKFTLPNTYVFFEENIKRLRVIPRHIFKDIAPTMLLASPYALEPVGNGPYRVRRVVKESDGTVSRYDLVPNRHHIGGKPYIQSFSLLTYKNQEALERAYRSRTINGFGVTGPLFDTSPRGKITILPMSRYYAIFFNLNKKNAVIKNRNARIALDRAISRERIVNEVFENNARIIAHPVLSRESTDISDSETAQELFGETKIKNPTLTLTVPRTPFLEKTATIVKEEWEKLGVVVTIEVKDPKEIFETVIADNSYEALLFGNILENQDDLFSFWHSSQKGYPGLNLSSFSTQNTDQLLEKIRQTENKETRNAELDSLAFFISNESPAIFLYSVPLIYVHEEHLSGLENDRVLSAPAERFSDIIEWFVQKARVLR